MVKGIAEIAFGPILIGTAFNIVLYGVLVIQVYLYFVMHKKDRLWLKYLVVLLFLADTANAVFDFIYVYDALILNFGNVAYLARATWAIAASPAMTGLIACAVQCFYAWRVKIITGKIWVVVIIAAMAIISMRLGTTIAISIIPVFVDEFIKFESLIIIWLLCAVIADICISVALAYHLRKQRTGFAATDDIVNRIIRLTVQTGAITSACATIDLVIYLSNITGANHLIFNIPLSKLYTSTLMSSLNARAGWKFDDGYGETTTTVTDVNRDGTRTKSRTDIVSLQVSPSQQVFVHVESHEMADVENQKAPNHLFADAKPDGRQSWNNSHVNNNLIVGSAV